jgi:uncharacterized protein YaaW (UPF0174 family)
MASRPKRRITDPQTTRRPAAQLKAEATAKEIAAKAARVRLPTPPAMDDIFRVLDPEALSNIADYLKWDPVVAYTRPTASWEDPNRIVTEARAARPRNAQENRKSDKPLTMLSHLETQKRLTWLDAHRVELAEEVSAVGSHTYWKNKPYPGIVRDLARKLKVNFSSTDATPDIEQKIVKKHAQDAWVKLKPEERAKIEHVAAIHGKSLKGEMAGFAALATAQLSGFGVYMMGSTLLSAINGALGLGLGFGVFAGLSELISVAIGPPGWAVICLVAVAKLGAPNYKKLLPVVFLISLERQRLASGSIDLMPSLPSPRRRTRLLVLPITTAREPSRALAEAEAVFEREYDLIAQEYDCPNYRSLGQMGKELVRQIHLEGVKLRRPLVHQPKSNRGKG